MDEEKNLYVLKYIQIFPLDELLGSSIIWSKNTEIDNNIVYQFGCVKKEWNKENVEYLLDRWKNISDLKVENLFWDEKKNLGYLDMSCPSFSSNQKFRVYFLKTVLSTDKKKIYFTDCFDNLVYCKKSKRILLDEFSFRQYG